MPAPSPPRALRIAVLEADHPMPNTTAKFGSYGGVFSRLLTAAATSQLGWNPAATLKLEKFAAVDGELPDSPRGWDAVLITGSRHSAHTDAPWIVALTEYVRAVLAAGGRVIGVCFGHQILGRALGARVVATPTWELSVLPMQLSDAGRALFGQDALSVYMMHSDAVATLPAGAALLGSTAACANQGMYRPRAYISIQGHPEFNEEIVRELLAARRDAGVLTPAQYADGVARAADSSDGIAIARVFLEFVADGVELAPAADGARAPAAVEVAA